MAQALSSIKEIVEQHCFLNVVDVVQMLAARHSGRSWEEAIADHVPQRFVDRREREERQRREL